MAKFLQDGNPRKSPLDWSIKSEIRRIPHARDYRAIKPPEFQGLLLSWLIDRNGKSS
jgi:hypothetical protein